MGDVFGNRIAAERSQSTSVHVPMLNGLNYWNAVYEGICRYCYCFTHVRSHYEPWKRLSKSDKEKLLKNGIDENAPSHVYALIR